MDSGDCSTNVLGIPVPALLTTFELRLLNLSSKKLAKGGSGLSNSILP